MVIYLNPSPKNFTPDVVKALEEIQSAGTGELHFKTGEYHFYHKGSKKKFFAISNNSACDKNMVFPILDMENITIDGHGSVFVFHDVVFPFMISNSKNITIRNVFVDTACSPLVEFNLHTITEDGFFMDIDKNKSPYFVEDNSLCFQRENTVVSGKNELFDLHAVGRHKVQYFVTGDSTANITNLPAPLMKCDVTETPMGIYARYRKDTPSRCIYEEELITSIIDGKRNVDVIGIDRSEKINILNVEVACGIGMGIVGQLSRDICIDNFSTNINYHKGAYQTLTADALHFINCDGSLEIKNCTISDAMDDVLNVHGMYTILEDAEETILYSKIGHHQQCYFNPYRPGDRLEVIDNKTFEVVAEFIVETADFNENSGEQIIIKGHFSYGFEQLKPGFRIENPERMPDLHLHHNNFSNYPNIRISGAGEILVEENSFSNCNAALLCLDLAKYWYESGRVKHLVFRNNVLDNCNGRGGESFIRIGIDGLPEDEAPKIHKKIEIIGNKFLNVTKHTILASAVEELIIKNNSYDS